MSKEENSKASIDRIRTHLHKFIELSVEENEDGWDELIASFPKNNEVKCWERKKCKNTKCPAFKQPDKRCWITAGTLCPSGVQGKFAKKYKSCMECDVYRQAVYQNPLAEIEEHLLVLINNMRGKQGELKELAITDHLTKLYNRRYFDIYIQHEHEKLKRSKASITLMMIDLNDFKDINDEHGHLTGDFVLKQCAEILLKSIRKSDMVARYGGDEFVLVLHDCPARQPRPDKVVARIERNTAKWNESNRSARELGITISLSYGYTSLAPQEDIQSAMARADQEMYLYKTRKKAGVQAARSLGASVKPPQP